MNFTYNDLMPWTTGISLDRVSFRLPLTPFFVNPASYANQRTRGFHGDDFYLQFKSSGPFIPLEDMEIFCGTAAYKKFASVDLDEDATYKWSGSRTRSYLFNTEAKTLSVQTIEVDRPTIGNMWPDSSTTATQGVTDNDPPDHTKITLSEPVDKAWLLEELQRWRAESEEFRDATGGGLGTYSFIGEGATKSESDGYLGIVGGGDVVALGFTFSGEPSGMSGDEGELWNGNYSTWARTVTRKNSPILHRESSPNHFSLSKNLSVGSSIYRDGYTEMEVSEPLGDVWMDEYGVFQVSKALDDLPMMAADGYELGNLISYTDEGDANELTLVSRTGKRYRVKIETGHYDYDPDGSNWVSSRTHVLITDPVTFVATLTLDTPEEDAWNVRVATIEEEVEDTGGWKTVADVAQGDYPEALIGSNVAGNFLLLAAIKRRSGTRFGFYSLDYSADPDTRYRKRTFRRHLTPGTYHVDPGGCGGGVSGSADLEYVEAFDAETGVQLPREITQYSVTINGKNWTPEVTAPFESLLFSGSSETVKSATKIRREGSYETTGSFIVAFDAPDSYGKILSSEWIKASMTFADGINKADSIDLDPPASGQSLFFEGHRLTYDTQDG